MGLPMGRPTEYRPSPKAQIVGLPRVTRKLRFLPYIIAMSGGKQHDHRGRLPYSANQGTPDES
jgi:hypothetical protein